MISFLLLLIVYLNCSASGNGLKITSKSIEGTETIENGLTDKQLGIQRYFGELTFLRKDLNNWNNWGEAVKDVDCDGNTCIRYEIAGLAYSAALLGMQLPSYSQVSEAIMFNCIQRMTQQVVYQYIELFDDFKGQSTYPDPVVYKNIMFSGHLLQMISMFEGIFGNFTFANEGWDFIWIDPTFNQTQMIHYTTSRLMEVVYQQSLAYEINGVPCEPDSVFIICNNYPQNGWLLYDTIYHSNYSEESVPAWYKMVKKNGVNHHQETGTKEEKDILQGEREVNEEGKLENFFKLDYLIKPLGIWEPVGSIGSDVWALSWMKTWWPATDLNDTLTTAFQFIQNSSCWVQVTEDLSNASSSTSPLLPYSYLHPSESSQKLFPLNDMITTSFYPMIEKQFLPEGTLSKYTEVLNYFENQFGQDIDLDNDGISDLYQYNSLPCDSSVPFNSCDSGDYAIWSTANLLIAMLHPENHNNYLRELFYPKDGKAWYQRYQNQSKLESVEYPTVMVAFAKFSSFSLSSFASMQQHNLTVVLKPGDQPPVNRYHNVIFSHIPTGYLNNMVIRVNGIVSESFTVLDESGEYSKVVLKVPGWSSLVSSQLSFPIHIELLY
jgi:hypothetical protein